MKHRKLGKNGFVTSEIGLGCWQLGGDWGATLAEEKAFHILQAAVDQGITLFDTADVYGSGRSERIIGMFLKECKTPVKVITKYGRGAGIYPDGYTKKSLIEGVEGSLERLGVKSLDLLQLHCIPTEILEKGEVFTWLREIQSEGLIKHFGASIESEEQAQFCLQEEGLLSLQIIFNLFRQDYLGSLFAEAKRRGTGIIVRLPLASGLLTGKFDEKTRFDENDHRNYNRNGEAFNVGETFSGLPFSEGLKLVDELKSTYLPDKVNMVEFALRWILDQPEVSCVIPGASSINQVQSNSGVSDLPPLSNQLHATLNSFYKTQVKPKIRGPI